MDKLNNKLTAVKKHAIQMLNWSAHVLISKYSKEFGLGAI